MIVSVFHWLLIWPFPNLVRSWNDAWLFLFSNFFSLIMSPEYRCRGINYEISISVHLLVTHSSLPSSVVVINVTFPYLRCHSSNRSLCVILRFIEFGKFFRSRSCLSGGKKVSDLAP
ncbi:hypothetical protein X975_14774, partial [Stegodyphus mimosarum]